VTDPESNITSLFLASGASDSKIRVWRITPTVSVSVSSTVDASLFSVEGTQEASLQGEDEDEDEEVNEVSESANNESGSGGAAEGTCISEEGLGEARFAFKCSTFQPHDPPSDPSDPPSTDPSASVAATASVSPSGSGSGRGGGGGGGSVGVTHEECSARYLVTLDALLVGHEDWVSSVHWVHTGMRQDSSSSTSTSSSGTLPSDPFHSTQSFSLPREGEGSPLKLFSTSMDRNMVLWCPEEESGIWLPTTRMGDIGGNLGGSVGGNLLGFVGSCIDLRSHSVLGVGYGGSFHLWQWRQDKGQEEESGVGEGVGGEDLQLQDQEEKGEGEREGEVTALPSATECYAWRPVSFLTGHFAAVRDVVWGYNQPSSSAESASASASASASTTSNTGPFLISVSADQTCRLFSPLLSSSSSSSENCNASANSRKWCELSRPQIHGYDLSCVQLAPLASSPFTLYSGGDEKAIRIFEAPLVVAEGLVHLSDNASAREYCANNTSKATTTTTTTTVTISATTSALKPKKVHRAFIPELGLSNKPADLMSGEEVTQQASRGVVTSLWLSGAPLEGQLSDYTIWPEVKKLFGHVGDVVCLSASPCGRWIASAGKGRDATSASVRLWETRRMVCVAVLAGHESTVTALRFSPDSR
jgi:elongator complex protein 2